jgi:mutator protein MutT
LNLSSSVLIEVATAVIQKDGKFLITQRKKEEHLGGFWEFPGGKREANESFEDCLIRELREELGVGVSPRSFLKTYEYQYPERKVRLFFYLCDLVEGEPEAKDCAAFRWVRADEIGNYNFPPADEEIIRWIREGAVGPLSS